MKVAVLPSGSPACRHYRLEQPARCVNALKTGDCEVTVLGELAIDGVRTTEGRAYVRDVAVPGGADVVVLQNPTRHVYLQVTEHLQRQGVAVVVDVDDHYSAIHLRNRAWRGVQPQHSPLDNWQWLERTCAAADMVTAPTRQLAEMYGAPGRRAVLPNYIGRDVLDIRPARRRTSGEPARVGWTGTLQTHPGDLEVTGRGVAQAVRDAGAAVRVVGDGAGVRKALGVAAGVDLRDTGWVAFDGFLSKIAETIDVGIVPLADTAFNRAKSWLKVLELSALGIPTVASPTPANLEAALAQSADSPREWRARLGGLLAEPERATELGAYARQRVAGEMVAEDHAPLWVDAWRAATQHLAHAK